MDWLTCSEFPTKQGVEGPMQNSYLRLKADSVSNKFHPVLEGLEDAARIINGIYNVKVSPGRLPIPQSCNIDPDLSRPTDGRRLYSRIPDTDIQGSLSQGNRKRQSGLHPLGH